ncbi:methyltransferase-like protein 27 isoform X2 [Dipodomys merriami]|uniref:methyltransferase-like protein 27 isoform X2 n=1 Tax=Dipodomys merriami TaxID=94247 RepID=UPI003855F73F
MWAPAPGSGSSGPAVSSRAEPPGPGVRERGGSADPACGPGMPGEAVTPRMAPEEVRARVEAAHGLTDPAQTLHFYDRWAQDYDQDVAALQYRAPRLAVDCLINTCPGLAPESLILDVACGTGLVASQLQARGFLQLHGVDGSPEMLKQAQARGLYQKLSLCTLGQEPLPSPEGTFDAVLIVGALSHGQVPCTVIPELLRVTKPGSGLVKSLQNPLDRLDTLTYSSEDVPWDQLWEYCRDNLDDQQPSLPFSLQHKQQPDRVVA